MLGALIIVFGLTKAFKSPPPEKRPAVIG